MPELPEVETVRSGLERTLRGRRFAHVEQRRRDLRFPLPDHFARRLTGRRIESLGRRAKYILIHLDGGEVLAVHLGMTGRFSVAVPRGHESHRNGPPPPMPEACLRHDGEGLGVGGNAIADVLRSPPPYRSPTRGEGTKPEKRGETQLGEYVYRHGGDAKHDHLVFTMSDGTVVTYNDARRFGYMALIPEGELKTHEYFAGLGVEPLSAALSPAYLAQRARGKKVDLKALLMDQRIIAGLGNIYACEALFRARLDPFKPAARLATATAKPTPAATRLVAAIKSVLADAVRAGGSTLRDYKQADGSLGRFQNEFAVYGRAGEPCPRPGCRGRVRRKTQGGRSTFYCPTCQR
jgi:formamidopyrimidine-DNA glycosylase